MAGLQDVKAEGSGSLWRFRGLGSRAWGLGAKPGVNGQGEGCSVEGYENTNQPVNPLNCPTS